MRFSELQESQMAVQRPVLNLSQLAGDGTLSIFKALKDRPGSKSPSSRVAFVWCTGIETSPSDRSLQQDVGQRVSLAASPSKHLKTMLEFGGVALPLWATSSFTAPADSTDRHAFLAVQVNLMLCKGLSARRPTRSGWRLPKEPWLFLSLGDRP